MKNHLLPLLGNDHHYASPEVFHFSKKIPFFSGKKVFFVMPFFFILPFFASAQGNVIHFISDVWVTGETSPNQSDGSITFSLDDFQNASFEMHYDYKIPGNNQVKTSLQAANGILIIENLHPGDYLNVRLKVTDDSDIWSETIDFLSIDRSFFSQNPESSFMEPEDTSGVTGLTLIINCPTQTFTHCNGTTVSRSGLEGGFAYNISPADRTCGIEVSDSCTVEYVGSWLCIVGDFPPPLAYSQFNKVNYQGVGLDALTAARIAWIICHYDYPSIHHHPVINAIWQLTGTGGNQNEIYWASVNAVLEPDGSENYLVFYKSVIENNQNFVDWQCCDVDGGLIEPDQQICSGQIPVAFQEISESTGNGVLTYQWQQSLNGCDGSFTDIEEATGVVLQIESPVYQTTFFRRKVINTTNHVVCESYSNCLVVTVTTIEPPLIESVNQPTCYIPYGTVIFSGLPEYQWVLKISPGDLEYTGNTPNFTIDGLLPGQVYYAEIIDSNNCHSGLSEPINILSIPDDPTVAASSNGPVCAGTSIQLNCVTSSGTAPFTFSWTGPNGFISGVQNPVLPNATTAMSGMYMVNVTDSKGCSGTASVMVFVNPNPTVTVSSNGPVCAGTNIQLNCVTSSGTAPFSFSWTGPNGFISGVQNPVLPSATTAMSGTYMVNVTDSKGCSGTASVMVLVNPNPTVTVSSNGPVCAGTSIQLNCVASSGTAPFTFSWTGPNGFISGVQNPVLPNATIAMSGTYMVNVTDSKGCSGTASVVVVVNPNPTVTASSNGPVCAGTSIQLNCVASSGTAPFTFSWTGPNGFISGVQNPVLPNATAAMSGTYMVNVTDSKGCSGNSSVVVLVNPNPTVTASSNGPVCAGTSIQLNCVASSGTAPFTFSWTGPNGFISGVQNPVLPNATAAMSGTYMVNVTDSKGCSGTASVMVVVNPNPTVTASSNGPVCAGTSIQLNCVASSGTAPFTFSWTGPNGFISGVQNPVLPNATIAMSGTYMVNVTDSKGCSGTASVMVVVNPNPTVAASSNGPVCAGTSIQLNCVTSSGTAPFTFSWTGPNGFISGVQNPVLPNATTAMSGTYMVNVTDSKGCSGTASVMVVVNPNPIVTASSNGPVCAGTSIQLNCVASSGTAPFTYSWIGPNGFISGVQNPVLPNATIAMSGTYMVNVTDSKGCSGNSSVVVLVNTVPKIISATPSNCFPLTNTYILNITVQYDIIAGDKLVLTTSEGQQLIVSATGSPQNIIWQGLPSNGNDGIDISIHFEQTPDCIHYLFDAYNAPDDCSCLFTGIDHVAVCHDAGTQDPADDYFRIKLNPIGYGYGTSYHVMVEQSDMVWQFGPFPYGAFTPYFGQFLIVDGGLEVSIADSQMDCGFVIPVLAPESCSACTHPVLTAGNIQCNGNTYDVFYYHSEGAVITANAGIISEYFVSGIPIGTDLEIIADLYGCSTVLSVKSPDNCEEDCDYPQITLGQPVCQGNSYNISFTWDGLGNMSRNAGMIQGDQIVNIPLGLDLVIVVTNGACITQIGVESPVSCDEPCENPLISLSGPLCKASDSEFYSVQYTLTQGVEIHVSAGIIGSGIIYHIPVNTSLIVTVGKEGCDDQIVIIPPPVCEDACTDPVLTVGDIECVGSTYNVLYYHSEGSVIQVNAGTIEEYRIVGIPIGVELEIIARDGACLTILKVASPADCEADCDYSQLTAGQPVCVGSTYSVSFTWDGLGNLNKNAGKIRGTKVIDIPLGVDLILTVTNGACITKITVKAPIDCDCIDPCRKPLITLSGPLCGPVGSDFYSVNYFIRKGVVVITSAGIVGNGVIYNIPNGVSIQVIAQWPGCEDQVVVVPAPECEQPCIAPMLTVGNVVVKNEYFDVDFWHSLPSVISVNAGNIENNRITGVPEDVVLVIKATDGACETEIRVTGPETCTENCIHPELTVGQGVCTGDSYKVSFVWNGVGELTRNSGIISGNEIINIPLGIDLILTATNCDCSVQLRVVNPKDCTEICDHPAVSIGGTQCSPDNDTYSLIYSADPWALISTGAGVIGAGQISGIEAGLPVGITSGHENCAAQIMQIPAPSCEFSSIGNFVWHDLNGDGLQNAGEPGIEGVALRLYDGLGNVIKTTQTNTGGFYEFGQLIPGEYFVEIVRPEDYSDFTLSKQGMDPAKDSNFDHANGYGTTSLIFLGSKAEDNNIDAGLYQCAEIAGQVWFDENQNDVLDTEEIGINGLQVKLFRREHTTWTLWDYIYTQNKVESDEAGHWNFCVNPGEYYLEIPVVPVGMTVVLPFAGTDPEKDSDLTGANGARTTDAFTVGSGEQKTAIGAGFSVGSTLGNLVWFDENSNGYLDENESGMQGVSVDLFDEQGQEAGTVSTDDAGEFVFEGLKKGIYFIRVNQPQGYTFTTPKTERDDANGSDVNHANGWGTTSLYPLEAGESILLTAGLIYASLPVELTEFSGENHGDHNVLTWTTEREENSDRFILERKHASETGFKAVGTVMAKGNGVEKQVYSFEDHQLPATGVYYYRLDQRDKNGTKKYSKIIALEVEKEMTNGIAVFPNPARGRFEVRMELQEAGLVNMELLDSRGITVRKDLLNSRLEPGHYIHVVELNGLSAGMYQLKVQTEKLLFMERVMVIE